MIWQGIAVVCLGGVVLGQGSIVWRGCGEDGVGAEVVGATSAVVAAVMVSFGLIIWSYGLCLTVCKARPARWRHGLPLSGSSQMIPLQRQFRNSRGRGR